MLAQLEIGVAYRASAANRRPGGWAHIPEEGDRSEHLRQATV